MISYSVKALTIKSVITVICLFMSIPALGTVYYIDFDRGMDSNQGISPAMAFKHCPGDPAATSNSERTRLNAGDVVRFKGGVIYRGMVYARWSGIAGRPVIYDGNSDGRYGVGQAYIDGSEIVTGWKRCTSPVEAMGNENYKNIYYTSIPRGDNPFILNLCEGDRLCPMAQDPNPRDFLQMSDLNSFRVLEKGSITKTELYDPVYLKGKKENAFENAYLLAWVVGNRVNHWRIDGYKPSDKTVYYGPTDSSFYPPDKFKTKYSILNAMYALDRPGEFAVNLKPERGLYRVYVWPYSEESITGNRITISRRDFGIILSGVKYVTIRGFRIQKQSGVNITAAIHNPAGKPSENVIIENNEATLIGSEETAAGFYLSELSNSSVRNNKIHNNPTSKGMLLIKFNNSECSGNNLRLNGGTSITVFGSHKSKIIGNTVKDHLGVHANGITIYLKSSNMLVYGNTVINGGIAFTCEESKDLVIARNVFLSPGETLTVGDWGDNENLWFLNNVILNETGKKGLMLNKSTANVVISNNIISGSMTENTRGKLIETNNLYTSLSWVQEKRSIGKTEIYEPSLYRIFENPDKLDFRLKEKSPAIDRGIDTADNIGLKKDPYGTSVPAGSATDIGAYEYIKDAK